MDAVGQMLDEAEELEEKAKKAIKSALEDENNQYHDTVTFFMRFHRDDVNFFRGPTHPSCPLPRWWTFYGSSVLAALWMEMMKGRHLS